MSTDPSTAERPPLAWITAERVALADLLEDLSDEQWTHPSLCDGWQVRHVVAHLTMPFRLGLAGMARGLVRHRFRFDQFARQHARQAGDALDRAELIDVLRQHADDPWTPPGVDVNVAMVEVAIHGEDIRQPLRIERDDVAVFGPVLDASMTRQMRSFLPPSRVEGLWLSAPDVGWVHGNGPEVEGSGADLALALWGRAGAVEQLTGPGVRTLRLRLAQE
ncbi:MAG: maleylpyruvate isomerase family mycothiol-dependent enzyme [Ornithinimicrobium sp.]